MKKLLLALTALLGGFVAMEAREKSCSTCHTCKTCPTHVETRTVKRPYTIQVCHDETRYEEVEQTRKVCEPSVGEWSCGKKKCGQCHVCKREKSENNSDKQVSKTTAKKAAA
jgi:hypothetical protein